MLTNLMAFTSNANNVIESNAQLDVVGTDFNKAFDRLLHMESSPILMYIRHCSIGFNHI